MKQRKTMVQNGSLPVKQNQVPRPRRNRHITGTGHRRKMMLGTYPKNMSTEVTKRDQKNQRLQRQTTRKRISHQRLIRNRIQRRSISPHITSTRKTKRRSPKPPMKRRATRIRLLLAIRKENLAIRRRQKRNQIPRRRNRRRLLANKRMTKASPKTRMMLDSKANIL